MSLLFPNGAGSDTSFSLHYLHEPLPFITIVDLIIITAIIISSYAVGNCDLITWTASPNYHRRRLVRCHVFMSQLTFVKKINCTFAFGKTLLLMGRTDFPLGIYVKK